MIYAQFFAAGDERVKLIGERLRFKSAGYGYNGLLSFANNLA